MTIYTVMASTTRAEWIAKSFTCRQTATEFLQNCVKISRAADSLAELLMFSPDPTIHTESVKCKLSSNRINYRLHINELVTDAFMELTLQPHKPKHQFKEFL